MQSPEFRKEDSDNFSIGSSSAMEPQFAGGHPRGHPGGYSIEEALLLRDLRYAYLAMKEPRSNRVAAQFILLSGNYKSVTVNELPKDSGVLIEDFVELRGFFVQNLTRFQEKLRKARGTAIAFVALFPVLPISIPLCLYSGTQYEACVKDMIALITELKRMTSKIALSIPGAQIDAGIKPVNLLTLDHTGGGIDTNVCYLDIQVVLTIPTAHPSPPYRIRKDMAPRPHPDHTVLAEFPTAEVVPEAHEYLPAALVVEPVKLQNC